MLPTASLLSASTPTTDPLDPAAYAQFAVNVAQQLRLMQDGAATPTSPVAAAAAVSPNAAAANAAAAALFANTQAALTEFRRHSLIPLQQQQQRQQQPLQQQGQQQQRQSHGVIPHPPPPPIPTWLEGALTLNGAGAPAVSDFSSARHPTAATSNGVSGGGKSSAAAFQRRHRVERTKRSQSVPPEMMAEMNNEALAHFYGRTPSRLPGVMR